MRVGIAQHAQHDIVATVVASVYLIPRRLEDRPCVAYLCQLRVAVCLEAVLVNRFVDVLRGKFRLAFCQQKDRPA